MSEHWIPEGQLQEVVGVDGVKYIHVQYVTVDPTVPVAGPPVEPPVDPPEPFDGLPADDDIDGWLGRPLSGFSSFPPKLLIGDGARIMSVRDTYTSIQGDNVVLDGFYRADTEIPQSGDGLRIDGYEAPVDDVLVQNFWIGEALFAAVKNGKIHHVDGIQITGPHLVANVTLRRGYLGPRYNAALMVHDFVGTLTLDQIVARRGASKIHCVKLNTEQGAQATLVLRHCDIDEITLEGDWVIDDDGTSKIGKWEFT